VMITRPRIKYSDLGGEAGTILRGEGRIRLTGFLGEYAH